MGVAQKVGRGTTRESVWIYDQAARNALASAIAQIDGFAEQVHGDDWAMVKGLADHLWAAFWMGREVRPPFLPAARLSSAGPARPAL